MSDVNFEFVNSENVDKNVYNLSDVDIRNLKHYVKGQGHPLMNIGNIEQNDQGKISVDLYLNKIDKKNSFLSNDTYSYHHHHHHRYHNQHRHHPYSKHTHDQSIVSLPLMSFRKLSLEIAICGMPKNTKLPVPNENFSLNDGCFGDDAGFIIQKANANFLG